MVHFPSTPDLFPSMPDSSKRNPTAVGFSRNRLSSSASANGLVYRMGVNDSSLLTELPRPGNVELTWRFVSKATQLVIG